MKCGIRSDYSLFEKFDFSNFQELLKQFENSYFLEKSPIFDKLLPGSDSEILRFGAIFTALSVGEKRKILEILGELKLFEYRIDLLIFQIIAKSQFSQNYVQIVKFQLILIILNYRKIIFLMCSKLEGLR